MLMSAERWGGPLSEGRDGPHEASNIQRIVVVQFHDVKE